MKKMNKENLDELWNNVKHIGDIERLDYEAMVTLGSIFGEMRSEIIRLQKEVGKLKE